MAKTNYTRHPDLYDIVTQYLAKLPDAEDRAEALYTAVGAAVDYAETAVNREQGEGESVILVHNEAVDHTIRATIFKTKQAETMSPYDKKQRKKPRS